MNNMLTVHAVTSKARGRAAGCLAYLDNDEDIDCDDWEAFEAAWAGPGRGAGVCGV